MILLVLFCVLLPGRGLVLAQAATPESASPVATPAAIPEVSPAAATGSTTQSPARPANDPAITSSAQIGAITIAVEGNGPITAETVVSQYGDAIATATDQFASIFAVPSAQPFVITFVPVVNPRLAMALRSVHGVAWADPAGQFAIVDTTAFQKLTPLAATGVLRNLLSRPAMHAAATAAAVEGASASATVPAGLMDGIAQYLEVPPLANQASLGSLVQTAQRGGTLPPLDAILTGIVPDATVDAATMTASAYAFTAFIIARSGVGGLRAVIQAFSQTPTIDEALAKGLGQPMPEIEKAWNAFLPRWFTTGWQTNAIAAFDLTPAQQLFDRGAYAAAADRARQSQQLYTDLGDDVQLSRVETLLALCAVALQAETLMTETQSALANHEYARAEALLAQADAQYAMLPEAHRPVALLQQYHQLAADGVEAIEQLASAQASTDSWLSLRSGRVEARAAGQTFAQLGDDARASEARALLSRVDQRVRRLALILATLAVVLTTWFGFWMRSRAPQRFAWSR